MTQDTFDYAECDAEFERYWPTVGQTIGEVASRHAFRAAWRKQAEKIAELEARLEVSSTGFDGIYSRDETIRLHEERILELCRDIDAFQERNTARLFLLDTAKAKIAKLEAAKQEFESILRDDAFAASFQTLGQYRAALIKALV